MNWLLDLKTNLNKVTFYLPFGFTFATFSVLSPSADLTVATEIQNKR